MFISEDFRSRYQYLPGIDLPDTTAYIFEIFLECIEKRVVARASYHSMIECVGLYILAEQFRCISLKNAIMDVFQDNMRKGSKSGEYALLGCEILSVFEQFEANENNPFRKFCIATIAYDMCTTMGAPVYHVRALMHPAVAKQLSDYREINAHTHEDPRERTTDGMFDLHYFHEHSSQEDREQCYAEPNSNSLKPDSDYPCMLESSIAKRSAKRSAKKKYRW